MRAWAKNANDNIRRVHLVFRLGTGEIERRNLNIASGIYSLFHAILRLTQNALDWSFSGGMCYTLFILSLRQTVT